MKRYFPFVLLFYLVQFGFAQKKERPIKVIEATQHNWISGAPGGRTGTNYSIKVYINTSRKVEFKNLWIGADNVEFDIEFFSLDIPKKIQQGDSILLTFNKVSGESSVNSEAMHLPIAYKGEALIATTIDSKARYFIVKSFKRLKGKRT